MEPSIIGLAGLALSALSILAIWVLAFIRRQREQARIRHEARAVPEPIIIPRHQQRPVLDPDPNDPITGTLAALEDTGQISHDTDVVTPKVIVGKFQRLGEWWNPLKTGVRKVRKCFCCREDIGKNYPAFTNGRSLRLHRECAEDLNQSDQPRGFWGQSRLDRPAVRYRTGQYPTGRETN